MAAIGEVVVNFNLKRQLSPAQIEAQSKAVLRVLRSTAMPRPPVRNPNGLSRRERILALYRKQGRPQAHLDRVMRMGRA